VLNHEGRERGLRRREVSPREAVTVVVVVVVVVERGIQLYNHEVAKLCCVVKKRKRLARQTRFPFIVEPGDSRSFQIHLSS